jgi:glycosyltransferase involved in cell wall biosynthesis
MDYLPNVDAVVWFCDEVLPLIHAQMPEASFVICGSRPVRAVRRLARRRGVSVTGWVPDTRPYLDSAEVFVAPLRMARGIQNKLLEAMAMGLPCVASVTAASGTVITDREGILTANEPEACAEHVLRLLREENFRLDMARKARAAVEAHYRWDVQMAALDQVIAEVTARRPPSVALDSALTGKAVHADLD